jgi:hypothetical protein
LSEFTLKNEEIRMKKLVLVCTMVAALVCLAYAEYQVNLPGYDAGKERYYQLIDKVVAGTATQAEAAELSDLCQTYGFDVPVTEPVEERGGENLDQGDTTACTNLTVIGGCPYSDTGYFDGDNDCSPSSASPYNDVFYEFRPPYTGWYQMRARSYTTGVAAIRIVKDNCCTGTSVRFSSSSVATDCQNPIAPGMEPSTVVTYLFGYLSSDTTYWIHVGTSSSTASTAAYEFNLWCIPCPPDESPTLHNTCETAQEIACNDSILGDSAYTTAPASPDWYKIVVPDFSPNACSLYVFVGGREMGHCVSGRYPAYSSLVTDARYTFWKEHPGEPCVLDSIYKADDEGCSYDAVKTFAVDPGTYYIKVWNFNVYEYVLVTRCIPYNPVAACCFLDGSCADMASGDCAAAGGWSKPIGTLCSSSPCPTGQCPYEVKDVEPNNACDASQDVLCDRWYCGAIGSNTDVDWYRLVVTEGVCESLVVDIYADDTPSQWPFGQGLNPYVYLYKSDCVTSLAYNDNYSGTDPDPVNQDSRLTKVVGPGTYYIKVYSSGSSTSGPYVMHITCITRECLPGDFCSNAIEIRELPFVDTLKTTCGFLDDYRPTCLGSYGNGPDVIYSIQLDGQTCFACSLFATGNTGGSPYGSVSLYANCPTDPAEPCIAKSVAASIGPYGFTCQGIEGPLPAGTYWIMVDNWPSPLCINYTLRVFPCECPNPCPYPNRDDELNNNSCGTMNPPIACGEKLCGMISATTDVDWYQFIIEECDSVWVKAYANDTPGQWAFGQGLDPYAYLYKSDCVTLVGSNDDIGGSPYNNDSWIHSAVLFPGTYYIKITSTSSTIGPYILELTCFPEACPDTTGNSCADAKVIAALPYYDTWTTCQYYTDNYNATCLGSYDNGPDVLYRFEVTTRICATCSLTNVTASSWPGMAIFDGCPDVGTCLIYKTGSSGPLGTTCQIFDPGHVYYIMVDNYPSPACITSYRLELEPCDCPLPCDQYVLCGSPGEVEPNNTCPPPVEQAGLTCDATVYGLHCPYTDTDFWKVTVPAMAIMTLRVYTGPDCDVNPPVGLYARYYDDACASPTSGTSAAIVISNTTASPMVKYLEVYDNGNQSQTLYKVVATCCYVTDYCLHPIFTGQGGPPLWTFEDTVNTCCATNVVDTVGSRGCALGSRFVSGPDVIFKFILSSTNIVSITVATIGSGDGQFSLFTDCANPKTSCIVSRDSTTGTTVEEALNLVLAAGTYYVSVSHYGATACGDMWIRIKSDCPLPVNLLGDVVATAGSEKVTLSWATASETNSDHFEIVRNGRVIGRVDAAGTSASRHDYTWSEEGLNNGTTYAYTLRSVDINTQMAELATVSATPSFAAGEVTEYALHQNYPNPFNPITTIAFDLLEVGNVNLKVYNLMGQEVRAVVNGTMPKGRHVVSFDAGNLASGIYLYRIEVNGFVAEKKMLLMK